MTHNPVSAPAGNSRGSRHPRPPSEGQPARSFPAVTEVPGRPAGTHVGSGLSQPRPPPGGRFGDCTRRPIPGTPPWGPDALPHADSETRRCSKPRGSGLAGRATQRLTWSPQWTSSAEPRCPGRGQPGAAAPSGRANFPTRDSALPSLEPPPRLPAHPWPRPAWLLPGQGPHTLDVGKRAAAPRAAAAGSDSRPRTPGRDLLLPAGRFRAGRGSGLHPKGTSGPPVSRAGEAEWRATPTGVALLDSGGLDRTGVLVPVCPCLWAQRPACAQLLPSVPSASSVWASHWIFLLLRTCPHCLLP